MYFDIHVDKRQYYIMHVLQHHLNVFIRWWFFHDWYDWDDESSRLQEWTRRRDEEWSWQLKHADSMDRLSSWRKRTRLSSWDYDDDDDADAGGSGGGGGGDADADVDYCSIWLLSDVLH